ncbi:MAG: methyltransferase domain-containing protein [Patescibacteria group bacterium]
MKKRWFTEKLANFRIAYRIKKVLIEKKTKFQTIQIFDLFDYGKSLFINGTPQSSEKDEWVYHECLIHPALISQPIRKNLEVLVLGAGEGATLRELLKYKNIKKITAVDIDKEAIEIFQKFLPELHQNSFYHPRVNLIFDSALNFLKRTVKKFDFIFSDLTVFSFFNLGSKVRISFLNFCQIVFQKLKKNGIFVTHTYPLSEVNYKEHFKVKRIIKKIFPKVFSYRVYISFFDDLWGFLIASKNERFNPLNLSEKTIEKRLKENNLEKKLKYFSPEIYKTLFILPPFLKKLEFKK